MMRIGLKAVLGEGFARPSERRWLGAPWRSPLNSGLFRITLEAPPNTIALQKRANIRDPVEKFVGQNI